jgi:hypothetical protein
VQLGTGTHVRCTGQGRKDRCTPLTKPAAAVLRVWLTDRPGNSPDPLFATRHGTALSRHAVAHLVTKHAAVAARTCHRSPRPDGPQRDLDGNYVEMALMGGATPPDGFKTFDPDAPPQTDEQALSAATERETPARSLAIPSCERSGSDHVSNSSARSSACSSSARRSAAKMSGERSRVT